MAEELSGILPVYKPSGMTSHDVVDRIRRIAGQRSVGHAGTLDPAAEGLLILCLGKSTKLSRFLIGQTKCYRANIALGRTSTTWDVEGVDFDASPAPLPDISMSSLEKTLDRFRGEIEQRVPAFSAVQVDGERLYKKARRSEAVETPKRQVTIHQLKLVSFNHNRLTLEVKCSSGTYIRSLAHEIGEVLGCGAYLAGLVRTKVGRIDIKLALPLEQLEKLESRAALSEKFVPVDGALEFGSVQVRDEFVTDVRHGRIPIGKDLSEIRGEFAAGDAILVKDSHGSLLAVARATRASRELTVDSTDSVLSYERVLV